jgi:propionyl-CoA carboxylase alpha chain
LEPKSTQGDVRCDSGIVEGSEISIYYDPLICKLCTYGENREAARHRMEKALDEYVIKGVTHNIPLLRDVISHPRFASGHISTGFLAEEYPTGFKGHALTDVSRIELLTVAAFVFAKRDLRNKTWLQGGGSLANLNPSRKSWDLYLALSATEEPIHVQVTKMGDTFQVSLQGQSLDITSDWLLEDSLIHAELKQTGESKSITVQYLEPLALGFRLQFYGSKFDILVKTKKQHALSKFMKVKPKMDLTSMVLSPMPGSVVSVAVKEGDTVSRVYLGLSVFFMAYKR